MIAITALLAGCADPRPPEPTASSWRAVHRPVTHQAKPQKQAPADDIDSRLEDVQRQLNDLRDRLGE